LGDKRKRDSQHEVLHEDVDSYYLGREMRDRRNHERRRRHDRNERSHDRRYIRHKSDGRGEDI